MSSEADLFGVFEMPYLVKDRKHMAKIEKEVFWPKIAPEAEKKGLKVLAVWENGYRHITNSKRPINVPTDLQGIKLRVPEGKWRVKMFQTYGANPSPMKFSEVFTALQTGVMDGQENPFTQIYSAKFQEVQKFLSLTGHVYTPATPPWARRMWRHCPPTCAVRSRNARAPRRRSSIPPRSARRRISRQAPVRRYAGEHAKQGCVRSASKPVYDEFAKECGLAGSDRPRHRLGK